MLKIPVPDFPTYSVSNVQFDPVPSTVAVPEAPALYPIYPFVMLTVPPLVTFNVPVPLCPTVRLPPVHVDLVPATTIVPNAPAP
jgi:hypothetical protein